MGQSPAPDTTSQPLGQPFGLQPQRRLRWIRAGAVDGHDGCAAATSAPACSHVAGRRTERAAAVGFAGPIAAALQSGA